MHLKVLKRGYKITHNTHPFNKLLKSLGTRWGSWNMSKLKAPTFGLGQGGWIMGIGVQGSFLRQWVKRREVKSFQPWAN
jgi:hypothetical protein